MGVYEGGVKGGVRSCLLPLRSFVWFGREAKGKTSFVSPLRAGEALHLAIIRRLGAQIASLDRRLCAVAKEMGFANFELL